MSDANKSVVLPIYTATGSGGVSALDLLQQLGVLPGAAPPASNPG